MRNLLRTLAKPLLDPLEAEGEFVYRRSHRVILLVMSSLFLFLAGVTLWLMPEGEWDYILPVLVFGGAGVTGLIVGTVGKDIAVARLWGSRN
jgi:hypothetical protein